MKIKKRLCKRLTLCALVAVCMASTVAGCGNSTADDNKAAQDAPESTVTAEEGKDTTQGEETAQNESEGENEESESFPFYILFADSVRNDVTGRWRLARTSDNFQIQDYALDYYKAYFKSDDEIHAVVNFTLNTTTRISIVAGSLDVTIFERVDKEEHDAKLLFSGDLLAEYFVNMDTGEIEKIQ